MEQPNVSLVAVPSRLLHHFLLMTGRRGWPCTGDRATAAIIIDYSQGPDFAAVEQLVCYKIYAPALMNAREYWSIQPMSRLSIAPWPLTAQIQPFQAI
jgi:hypothetical protein